MRVFIGTQYYRPPNPERQAWETDLAIIKKKGFDVVRFWVYWAKVNPRPGVWDFSDYDCLFDLAEKNGLKVLIQLVPESQPDWFFQMHEDLRPRTSTGALIPQGSHPMIAFGVYPGLTFDHRVVREAFDDFFRRVVERFKSRPSLFGWDVWNELQHAESYDEVARRRFIAWLKLRYRSIKEYNRLRCTSFSSFEEIHLPESDRISHPFMLDWNTFEGFRLGEEMKRRANVVRRLDPGHLIVSHARTPYPCSELEDWRVIGSLDAYGTSEYISRKNVAADKEYALLCLYFAGLRGSCGAKPWWMSETAGGSIYYLYGHVLRSPADIRSRILMTFGAGGEGVLFWLWKAERFGQESHGWGLTNLDGSVSDRIEAASEVAKALKKHTSLLEKCKRPPSPVALVADPKAGTVERCASQWVPPAIFAHQDIEGWAEALLSAQIPFDCFSTCQIAEQGIPEHIRLIVLPMALVEAEGLYKRLAQWVRAGGMLISGPYLGMFDPHGWAHRITPPAPLDRLAGLRVIKRYYVDPVRGAFNPRGTYRGVAPLEGCYVVEEVSHLRAVPIAASDGRPILYEMKSGEGAFFYCATPLGIGFSQRGGGLAKFLERVASTAKITRPVRATGGLYVEWWIGPKMLLFYLTNPRGKPVKSGVLIEGACGKVRDLLHDTLLPNTLKKGRISLTVPPHDTLWLSVPWEGTRPC